MLAAPVGAAHTVRASRDVPNAAQQRRVVGVLREQPVRSAVAERQDRLGAGTVANRDHPLGDVIERLVPA